MHGHLKFVVKGTYGWLNPYFNRTWDGDTDMGHYIKLSQTNLNEWTKEFLGFFDNESMLKGK